MSAVTISDPDRLAIATIRTLFVDPVQKANSGQPGIAIARLAASAGG
jgi:transketolase